MDLRPCRSLHPGSPNHHGTGAAEPEAPRGVASRSTKSIFFIDIDRWVFRCAVVQRAPAPPGALVLWQDADADLS